MAAVLCFWFVASVWGKNALALPLTKRPENIEAINDRDINHLVAGERLFTLIRFIFEVIKFGLETKRSLRPLLSVSNFQVRSSNRRKVDDRPRSPFSIHVPEENQIEVWLFSDDDYEEKMQGSGETKKIVILCEITI